VSVADVVVADVVVADVSDVLNASSMLSSSIVNACRVFGVKVLSDFKSAERTVSFFEYGF
jgi:hypothetical protein